MYRIQLNSGPTDDHSPQFRGIFVCCDTYVGNSICHHHFQYYFRNAWYHYHWVSFDHDYDHGHCDDCHHHGWVHGNDDVYEGHLSEKFVNDPNIRRNIDRFDVTKSWVACAMCAVADTNPRQVVAEFVGGKLKHHSYCRLWKIGRRERTKFRLKIHITKNNLERVKLTKSGFKPLTEIL